MSFVPVFDVDDLQAYALQRDNQVLVGSGLHQPGSWSESDTLDYPAPIIDRNIAIQQTLARFEQAKLSAETVI